MECLRAVTRRWRHSGCCANAQLRMQHNVRSIKCSFQEWRMLYWQRVFRTGSLSGALTGGRIMVAEKPLQKRPHLHVLQGDVQEMAPPMVLTTAEEASSWLITAPRSQLTGEVSRPSDLLTAPAGETEK